MPALVAGIHVLVGVEGVDGRDTSAFTRVFDALCPAMTMSIGSSTYSRTNR
jgi:hypothetical protein